MVFVNIDGGAALLARQIQPIDDALEGWEPQTLAYGGSLTFEVAANWKHIHENFIDVYHKFAIHPALCEFAPQERRGKGLPEALHREGRFLTMIPTCIQIWPNQLAVFQLQAVAPDRISELIHMYFVGGAASDEEHAGHRQDVYDMWDGLNTELPDH